MQVAAALALTCLASALRPAPCSSRLICGSRPWLESNYRSAACRASWRIDTFVLEKTQKIPKQALNSIPSFVGDGSYTIPYHTILYHTVLYRKGPQCIETATRTVSLLLEPSISPPPPPLPPGPPVLAVARGLADGT